MPGSIRGRRRPSAFIFTSVAVNRCSLQQRLEVSSDLVNWTTLTNYTSTDLTVQILDPSAATSNHKFYRAIAP